MAACGEIQEARIQPSPRIGGLGVDAGDAPRERSRARRVGASRACILVTPVVLVPGLLCSSEIFAAQIPALWAFGPVTVASTLEGDRIEVAAASILRDAPPQFALAGISMGGYLSLEIIRQAPSRVLKLALLDTSARPDTVEQTDARLQALAEAHTGFQAARLRPTAGVLP